MSKHRTIQSLSDIKGTGVSFRREGQVRRMRQKPSSGYTSLKREEKLEVMRYGLLANVDANTLEALKAIK